MARQKGVLTLEGRAGRLLSFMAAMGFTTRSANSIDLLTLWPLNSKPGKDARKYSVPTALEFMK